MRFGFLWRASFINCTRYAERPEHILSETCSIVSQHVEVNLIPRQRRRSAQFKVTIEVAKDTKTRGGLVHFTTFRMTRQA